MVEEEAWFEWATHKADELITHGFGSHALGHLGTAMVIAAAARYGTIRAFRNIAAGGAVTEGINLTRTDYWPTGKTNDLTKEEYHDQDIIVVGEVVLAEVFNQRLSGPIRKAIKKAEQITTGDNPVIYQHLPDVIGEKKWPVMKTAIQKLARGHFSGMFNKASEVFATEYEERQRPVDDFILPLLVAEPAPTERKPKAMQTKYALIPIRDGQLPRLPRIQNIRFHNPNSDRWHPEYNPGENQEMADRHRLMTRIYQILDNPKHAWLKDFSVRARTGERQRVARPTGISPAVT